jgi:hypothetical protein
MFRKENRPARRDRGGALLLGLLLTGALTMGPAEAQLSGSVHLGRSRSTTTAQGGRVETRSQGGSLNAYFGRRPSSHYEGRYWGSGASRSPYGRLNYGRPGYGYGGFGGGFGYRGPHSSTWSGLIDQNFAQMRRTSPFPNQYAGGYYNPRPHYHRFHSPSYGSFLYPTYGYYAYDGYAFGYSPALYGAHVPSVYSYYGSWYPPYLPQERVYVIEREVIREREDPEPRRDRAPREGRLEPSSEEEGEYYLAPKSGETLEAVTAEIRRAWMNGDFDRLRARMRKDGKVRVYLKGKYRYSVDAADFGQMTRDAMSRIDTISFTLGPAKPRGDDRAFVSGKHVYYDPERQKHEVFVSYGLAREDGRWKIAEAGSSTEAISTHTD